MSVNLRNYNKAIYALDAVVQRVMPDKWDQQSPCEDWTAREVLGHVIWHTHRIANHCNGVEPPAEQAEAEVAGGNPVTAWAAARDKALAALDSEGALQMSTLGPGGQQITVDEALVLSTFDATAHAWDIAKATSQPIIIPADLAELGYEMIQAAGDFVRAPGILGPAVESPGDDAVSRFVAICGRTP